MLVVTMFTVKAQNMFYNESHVPCISLHTDTLVTGNYLTVANVYLLKNTLADYDFAILNYYFSLSEDEKKIQNVNWLYQDKLWVYITKIHYNLENIYSNFTKQSQ